MASDPALDSCLMALRQQLAGLVRALADADVEAITYAAPALAGLATRLTMLDADERAAALDLRRADGVHEVRWLLERCRRLAPPWGDAHTAVAAAYQPDGRTRLAPGGPGMLEVKG